MVFTCLNLIKWILEHLQSEFTNRTMRSSIFLSFCYKPNRTWSTFWREDVSELTFFSSESQPWPLKWLLLFIPGRSSEVDLIWGTSTSSNFDSIWGDDNICHLVHWRGHCGFQFVLHRVWKVYRVFRALFKVLKWTPLSKMMYTVNDLLGLDMFSHHWLVLNQCTISIELYGHT